VGDLTLDMKVVVPQKAVVVAQVDAGIAKVRA
jgi:hypothetical protein